MGPRETKEQAQHEKAENAALYRPPHTTSEALKSVKIEPAALKDLHNSTKWASVRLQFLLQNRRSVRVVMWVGWSCSHRVLRNSQHM